MLGAEMNLEKLYHNINMSYENWPLGPSSHMPFAGRPVQVTNDSSDPCPVPGRKRSSLLTGRSFFHMFPSEIRVPNPHPVLRVYSDLTLGAWEWEAWWYLLLGRRDIQSMWQQEPMTQRSWMILRNVTQVVNVILSEVEHPYSLLVFGVARVIAINWLRMEIIQTFDSATVGLKCILILKLDVSFSGDEVWCSQHQSGAQAKTDELPTLLTNTSLTRCMGHLDLQWEPGNWMIEYLRVQVWPDSYNIYTYTYIISSHVDVWICCKTPRRQKIKNATVLVGFHFSIFLVVAISCCIMLYLEDDGSRHAKEPDEQAGRVI